MFTFKVCLLSKFVYFYRQFLMMKEFGFVYDSSIPAPLSDPPLWPYTLDYKIPHKCIGDRKCPSRY